MITSSSTVQLLHRWQDGSREAGDALYLRLYPKLRTIAVLALGKVAKRDPSVADDVVHKVFVSILERWRHESGEGKFEARQAGGVQAYLRTAVSNVVRSVHRSDARHGKRFVAAGETSGADVANPAAGPRTVAMVRESVERLYGAVEEAFAELPERERFAIGLRYVCGMRSKDMVAEMAHHDAETAAGFATEEKCRMTLYRALKRLRARLEVDPAVVDQYFDTIGNMSR